MLDLRRRAAAVSLGKAHGPSGVSSELFKALPASSASVYDSLALECTLSADVPLSWQGGDAGMPVKDPLKDSQDVENRRHVALADQPPKLVAGELRSRIKPQLEYRIVASQWGMVLVRRVAR